MLCPQVGTAVIQKKKNRHMKCYLSRSARRLFYWEKKYIKRKTACSVPGTSQQINQHKNWCTCRVHMQQFVFVEGAARALYLAGRSPEVCGMVRYEHVSVCAFSFFFHLDGAPYQPHPLILCYMPAGGIRFTLAFLCRARRTGRSSSGTTASRTRS